MSEPRKGRNRSIAPEARAQIFDRDGWRCQFCGSMRNLEIHHLRYRSHQGEHGPENLIVLCASCHNRVHRSR